MNANTFKTTLLNFTLNDPNFLGVRNVGTRNLNKADFIIELVSNEKVVHSLQFNYHLKLVEYKILNNHELLTKTSANGAFNVISEAKKIRREYSL